MRRRDLWILIVAAFLLAGLVIIGLSFDPPPVPIPVYNVQFQIVDTTPYFIHGWNAESPGLPS